MKAIQSNYRVITFMNQVCLYSTDELIGKFSTKKAAYQYAKKHLK